MLTVRVLRAMVAIALPLLIPADRALALCSPSALEAVRAEMRAAVAPRCGPKPLRRVFNRARHKAAVVTGRAVIQCTSAVTPRLGSAHAVLKKALDKVTKAAAAGAVAAECANEFALQLATMDADLTNAANGTETTTTTSAPGAPTTTTLPTCTVITLEVDKGDCTSVTSNPPAVHCGANCDIRTFTLPASGSLQLIGTPAPGDSGVSFGGDCDDDGTVPFADAPASGCTLSCDCSSEL